MASCIALSFAAASSHDVTQAAALPAASITISLTVDPELAVCLRQAGLRPTGALTFTGAGAAADRVVAELGASRWADRVIVEGSPARGAPRDGGGVGDPAGWLHLQTSAAGKLRATVRSDGFTVTDPGYGIAAGLGDLDLHPSGARRARTRTVTGYDAVRLASWADANGVTVVAPNGRDIAGTLRETAARSCVLLTLPGAPARGQAVVGPAAFRARGLLKRPRGGFVGQPVPGTDCHTMVPTVAQAHRLTALPAEVFHTDDHLRDALAMAAAAPYDGDDRLFATQAAIVGIHLTTRYGFVNSIDPGMGKTVTTLTAWKLRAAATSGWRGLAVVEASARSQWAREAATWFPDVQVVTVKTAADLRRARTAAATAGDRPLLVLTTYKLIVSAVGAALEAASAATRNTEDGGGEATAPAQLGGWLLDVGFDDVAADEAVGLRSPASKTSRTLWALRDTCQVAVALTGTPITRDLTDIGALLSWSRGRRGLTGTTPLADRYDLTSPRDRRRFVSAVGALLIRHGAAELTDELPDITVETVSLPLSAAETLLADTARALLAERYTDLTRLTATAVPSTDDARTRRTAQLRSARTACLSAAPLCRTAASDPAALRGSGSELVAELEGRGLLDDAAAAATKRRWARRYIGEQTAAGRQVLVFVDATRSAAMLAATLRDDGLEAGVVSGSAAADRDTVLASFAAGELDVLVATAVAERGLNLQAADVVVHFDLPATVTEAVQRTGRVDRIGQTSAQVTVVFAVVDHPLETVVADAIVGPATAELQVRRCGDSEPSDGPARGNKLAYIAQLAGIC